MNVIQVLLISFLFLLLSGFFIYFTVVFNRRVLKHRRDISDIVQEKDKQLLQATIETQENERSRIGANIHDDIGPLLSILKLKINNLFETYKEIDQDNVHDVNNLLDHLVNQVHKISKELVPSILYELGFETALQFAINKMQEISSAVIKPQVNIDYSNISKKQAISIYRIVQESLNNILKHSKASLVEVILKENGNAIVLIIKDNGKGFNFEETNQGLGLKNMNARVRALNGEFIVESAPNTGTTIMINIPIDESKNHKSRDN